MTPMQSTIFIVWISVGGFAGYASAWYVSSELRAPLGAITVALLFTIVLWPAILLWWFTKGGIWWVRWLKKHL